MKFDVVVVGAGPAGLAAAIRLRQLDSNMSVCVLEKGAEVGAHVLSGNVLEPRALDELLPEWRSCSEGGTELASVPASDDRFFFLTEKLSLPLPTPPQMYNAGNYVISLSRLTRWLGDKAESLGVEIYPGFAASEVLFDTSRGRVTGVATNDMGVAKDGSRKDTFEPGVEILGRLTLLAEGARGSLTKHVIDRFALGERAGADPQTYALGLKEVWRVDAANHSPGTIWHSVGYPIDTSTYGGSFLYHMSENRVSVGYIVALDYRNPYMSPYQEFQRFKAHPKIRAVLEGGTVLQYGARTLNEGGLQSIPALEFPGGALIGCAAGFLNVAKIKGTHTAMKSGMLAAETAFTALSTSNESEGKGSASASASPPDMSGYESSLRESWVWDELSAVRNIRPGFKYGLIPGIINAAFETYVTRGRSPWTLQHSKCDHEATEQVTNHKPISYPPPDGKVTFDILTSLALSGTNHDHDEPCHLKLGDLERPVDLNYPMYAGLEGRYCPAKVYEYHEDDDGEVKFTINAQNCLHCKYVHLRLIFTRVTESKRLVLC
jgi:electron-transferring-flavoprotein dehydrogenase